MKTSAAIASGPGAGPGSAVLVSPQWLAAQLGNPRVRVVEVDVSPAAYNDGHIDGAVLWNIYADLKDPDYRLRGPAALERLAGRSGIDPDSTVVFYGYAPALALWLMKLYGHRDVRMLDCSRDSWRAAGRPWSTAASEPASGSFRLGDEDPRIRADQAAVLGAIGQPGTVLHQPIDGLYYEDGSFRSAAELRRIFSTVDLASDSDLITYCTIGGRAATAWFVLTSLLGRDHVRVYEGSWAEWGRTPSAPVAC